MFWLGNVQHVWYNVYFRSTIPHLILLHYCLTIFPLFLQDNSRSQLHESQNLSESARGLNPHKIIPPISAPTKYNGANGDISGTDIDAIPKLLNKYLRKEKYLPAKSIVLRDDEELILRNKVHVSPSISGSFLQRNNFCIYLTNVGEIPVPF